MIQPVFLLQKGENFLPYHLDRQAFLEGYSYIRYYGNGVAKARKADGDKSEILLDRFGEPTTDPKLLISDKGMECFRQGGKWGFWKGNTVLIAPAYTEVGGLFVNGVMDVSASSGKNGYVDENGKVIAEPVYQSVEPFDKHSLGVVKQGDNKGVMDKTGKLIIPCEYTGIDIWEKFIIVKKDRKSGIFSLEGK